MKALAGFSCLHSLEFFLLRIGKILMGIRVLHVDDVLHARKKLEYKKDMDCILDTFEIKDDKGKGRKFSLLGRQVAQKPNGTVFVTMLTYLENVKPICITRTRRSASDAIVNRAKKKGSDVFG